MIFVDTSFWFRCVDAPTSIMKQSRPRETWRLINRREGHRAAVRFLDAVGASPRIRLAHVGRDVEDRALQWLRERDEREYSFVDATSFALMRKLDVFEAFAFGGDFAAAGFAELR